MKFIFKIIVLIVIVSALSSCGFLSKQKKLLDPGNPITVTVWNYYNGSVKDKFDSLVTEFNETVGTKEGIVVESQTYGDVNELADSVYESANKTMGALPMPNIFASYPDNAFRIDQVSELVNLEEYFSEKELKDIRDEFLVEGRFGKDQTLKILPIAKSTEVLYLNKTFWDDFSHKSGARLEELATWEGLIKIAKLYHDQTGKAFCSIDANANYLLVSSMQMGDELYQYQGEKGVLNLQEENAYRIWKNFYVPYINGFFIKTNRFSSDDLKTGKVIAYTGSTAGASYFPIEVAQEDKVSPIEGITLSYPVYQGGAPYAIQQGAGMCIAESDKSHEYASAMFLKWFINTPQNVEFAVSTAYLPVKKEALKADVILKETEEAGITSKAVQNSIKTSMAMFHSYKLYGNKPFQGSYNMRNLLETTLVQKYNEDIEKLNKRVAQGEDRAKVVEDLISKKNFEDWYQRFMYNANQQINQ